MDLSCYLDFFRRTDNPTTLAARRDVLEVLISMALYVGVLFASIYGLNAGISGAWRMVVALLPILPIAAVFAACVRFLRNTDEMERQITFESLALSAGVTAMLAVTYGFLQNGAHLPCPDPWWTYGVIMAGWLVARPFVARRYR